MVKLKDYIETLQQFAKENPDALYFQVVASSDDEGNSFNPVVFAPSKGVYKQKNREYYAAPDSENCNAVCIN